MGDWAHRAACRNTDPDVMFLPGADQHVSKQVCTPCPVRRDCLVEALTHGLEHGVWGGMTERERRALRRRHPRADWSQVFAPTG